MLFEVAMPDLMAPKNRGYSVTKKPSLRSLVTALMYSTLVSRVEESLLETGDFKEIFHMSCT